VALSPAVREKLRAENLMEDEPNPLHLPRHSLRTLIVLSFVGLAIYLAWLAVLGWFAAGRGAGAVAAVLVGSPALGFAGLWIRERWREAWLDVRRFFLLRQRPYLLKDLRRRQHEIAERLDALFVSPG
jgi:hypothetical protein